MPQFTLQQAFALALQHHQAGRLQDAEQIYRQILAQQPDAAEALHYLGIIAYQAGEYDIAAELIGRAITQRPDYALAHCNLGNALQRRGQIDQAIAAYRHAIALSPDVVEAYSNLGCVLRDTGQLDEAIAACRRAIALKPNYFEAYSNLGNALRDKGKADEAIAAFRQAIAIAPKFAEAHSNLGNVLRDVRRLDEALAACRTAIALDPNYSPAHNNLGVTLYEMERLDEAVAAYHQAIALNPNFVEPQNNLGAALCNMGRLGEAITAYRRAIATDPSKSAIHSSLVYTLLFHPECDSRAVAEEQRCWNRQHAGPLARGIQPHINDRSPDRRLRIGYVSPDFRDHVVGRNLLPLFRRHDRRQFEITCYANVRNPDAATVQFQQNSDHWRNIVGLSDDQGARQIRDDQIDILVDLTLHMENNRLLIFARKPAPVQVTFAGYPGSTGLEAIDYRLSDPYLEARGIDESIYSERTIRLPDSFWCYDPLDCRDIQVNPLPALSTVEGSLLNGLASNNGAVTFGCLNNARKVNDHVLSLWSQVLRRVQNSRLLILCPNGSHRQKMLALFSREGIDPGRIEFVAGQPRRAYLELYHRIDIGLDSFPYNGHTTSLDSFWMGVPVVTLVGQTVVSRAGWCQLSNLGLTELAAHTPAQFVTIAADLAADLPRLQELRSTLRGRMERSPLMDAPRFARNVEAAYRQMWRGWCEAGANLR